MLVYFKKAAGGLFGNTAVYKLVELWDKKSWLPRSNSQGQTGYKNTFPDITVKRSAIMNTDVSSKFHLARRMTFPDLTVAVATYNTQNCLFLCEMKKLG